MCLLLNVAPPPACLLFEDPTFSHILSLVSVGQSSIPPPPPLPVFSFMGFWDCNLFTSSPSSPSPPFPRVFACGLLVPPSPSLRKWASPQLGRRKLKSTQKHNCLWGKTESPTKRKPKRLPDIFWILKLYLQSLL